MGWRKRNVIGKGPRAWIELRSPDIRYVSICRTAAHKAIRLEFLTFLKHNFWNKMLQHFPVSYPLEIRMSRERWSVLCKPFSSSEILFMRELRVLSVRWRWATVSLYSWDFSSSSSLTFFSSWFSKSPSLRCRRFLSSLGKETPEILARICCCFGKKRQKTTSVGFLLYKVSVFCTIIQRLFLCLIEPILFRTKNNTRKWNSFVHNPVHFLSFFVRIILFFSFYINIIFYVQDQAMKKMKKWSCFSIHKLSQRNQCHSWKKSHTLFCNLTIYNLQNLCNLPIIPLFIFFKNRKKMLSWQNYHIFCISVNAFLKIRHVG